MNGGGRKNDGTVYENEKVPENSSYHCRCDRRPGGHEKSSH
jgi:hypothetical protein